LKFSKALGLWLGAFEFQGMPSVKPSRQIRREKGLKQALFTKVF